MGLVGKTVKVDGSGFNLKSGAAAMNITLATPATVTLTVKDASGKLVATLPKGPLGRGETSLTWDGRDAAGNLLPDGAYKVEVTATGLDGKAAAFTTSLTMKVDAVTFKNNGIYLASGDNIFSLADVLEITA
jgi:flagellar basal-body rod modification protein FlgD